MCISLEKDAAVRDIAARLSGAAGMTAPVKANGTWGSYAPMLAAYLFKTLHRPVLYITPHIDDADSAADDVQVFAGQAATTFPVWEGERGPTDATDEIGAQRLRLALWLGRMQGSGTAGPFLMTTCIQAINQPVCRLQTLAAQSLTLAVGQTMEPELAAAWLVDQGFERTDRVDMPGQFAHRGGIIDIFSPVASIDEEATGPAEPSPVRVEFFGDQIESIRRIDLDTQRSSQSIRQVSVVAPQPRVDAEGTELLLNLLPPETILIFEEPLEAQEVSEVFLSRLDDPRGLYPFAAIYKAAARFARLEISRFSTGADCDIHLGVTSAQQFEHKSGAVWKEQHAVLDELLDFAATHTVLLYCENQAEIQRVQEILTERGPIPDSLKLCLGFIRQGFILPSLKTAVITHHELFGQVSVRRRVRRISGVSGIDSVLDLQRGDIVVHITHGIGKFIGIKTMDKGDSKAEYLTLEYADKVQIHVPVSNIHLVQKYIGSGPTRPRLSKIGGKRWERQKEQVAQGVEELAAELLATQARRRKLGGLNFGQDTLWQKEFEESFLYPETPDQTTAAADIKRDMASDRPMDRLLCGDVGYGKTELAMRAAFKAVQVGKQVAILVPTTVLCVQHGRTFRQRFADFPVRVEVLNRFTAPKEIREILSATRKGQVDILIGTHRLLSDDVGFNDLGLLIIDEEQRFGVEHKERLKRFRINVDILTLTATPIPRTLHMSLIGLRDISSLSTPPLDRRSVTTRVSRYDPQVIRKAILTESARDGQVFYLHNRVQTIEQAAWKLRQVIGDSRIRVDIAHGQMAKHELEDAMIRFITGDTDVLVCSTIIESGIDIPNANTIIISEADRLGLAQLHQLRGRVGRYKHRAYAYLLLPEARSVTPAAGKRLKAIEEYSELGAGFRIALRDLEIRGAGNILGAEQSGHINTVGYELYCKLLANAVRRLKTEPPETEPQAVIDLGFAAYIPKNYIHSDRQRLEVYRRLATARTPKDLDRLAEELRDLFGPVPKQVTLTLELARIRLLADARHIKSIVVHGPDVIFTFTDGANSKDLFARYHGTVRIPDPRTVHLRLEKNYFEPPTLLALLRKLFGV
ncbi:MAG: transcription-repair coupling factor [Phycisphaerae bacterium]|nr:transcription-repair coupling factor [Phycisphaerae bacterium]